MKIIQKRKSEIRFRNDSSYRNKYAYNVLSMKLWEVGKFIGYVSAFNVFIKKNSLFIQCSNYHKFHNFLTYASCPVFLRLDFRIDTVYLLKCKTQITVKFCLLLTLK